MFWAAFTSGVVGSYSGSRERGPCDRASMPYAPRTNGTSHLESTYGFPAPPGQGERLAGRFEPKFIAPAPYFSQEDSVGTEVFLMVELPSSEDLDVSRELTAPAPTPHSSAMNADRFAAGLV